MRRQRILVLLHPDCVPPDSIDGYTALQINPKQGPNVGYGIIVHMYFQDHDRILKMVQDMGFVRDDGKTMTAQPHLNLDPKKMWTTEHLKRLGPLLSPNVLFNEMTPEERAAFHAKYTRGGPAGRFPRDDA